mmetsp:Transcript_3712/g.5878  ORF Transcript_3712/g.5878 Transcript_3712/m.5878 type:complete len:296 (+) Transcript_3712:1639-2526(+)
MSEVQGMNEEEMIALAIAASLQDAQPSSSVGTSETAETAAFSAQSAELSGGSGAEGFGPQGWGTEGPPVFGVMKQQDPGAWQKGGESSAWSSAVKSTGAGGSGVAWAGGSSGGVGEEPSAPQPPGNLDTPENPEEGEVQGVPVSTGIEESVTSLTPTTQAKGWAKLMGSGYEGCDNEEDAITGILLKDIPPARVARFKVSLTRTESGSWESWAAAVCAEENPEVSGQGKAWIVHGYDAVGLARWLARDQRLPLTSHTVSDEDCTAVWGILWATISEEECAQLEQAGEIVKDEVGL